MKTILLAGAFAALLPAGAFAAQLSDQDRSFMHQAAMGGLSEVQEGQAAQSKAQSPQVKQFAQRMVRDHTANNQELMNVARQSGMTPPTTLDSTHEQELAKLKADSGKNFDQAYIQHQVTDHQQMISLLQTEIQSGSDPQLKAYAQKTLPVIQEHLHLAQQLEGQG